MRIRVRVLAVALIFAVVLLHPRTVCQSVPEIVEKVGRSVVMVHVFDASGGLIGQASGFFISTNGLILTNAHVMSGAYSARVSTAIGVFDRIQILERDERRDLALLRVPTTEATQVRAPDFLELKPGERVLAIGNPLGLQMTVSDGMVSGIRQSPEGVELIQTTVPISPGSSGGVLLDNRGLVVGITTSTSRFGQNINFAVSLNEIRAFLRAHSQRDSQGLSFEQLPDAETNSPGGDIGNFVGGILSFFVVVVLGGMFTFFVWLISKLS